MEKHSLTALDIEEAIKENAKQIEFAKNLYDESTDLRDEKLKLDLINLN